MAGVERDVSKIERWTVFGAFSEFLKSLLPGRMRELLWRTRHLPHYNALRFHAVIRFGDALKALRVFHNDPGAPQGLVDLSLRGYPNPVFLRNGTSDLSVFGQVFLQGQYAHMPVRTPRVIIDGGANIGLTSLYFLRRYPKARVIAIEPDPENMKVAEKNLAPYRQRCTLIHGALWSHRTRLMLKRTGSYWTTQVTCQFSSGDVSVQAYSLADIIRDHGLSFIDLLKIDIEGAEENVFGPGKCAFLRHVSSCAIELHNEECIRIFSEAARQYGFCCWTSGELTIASKRRV
jgi:FkbM family methyltransferase